MKTKDLKKALSSKPKSPIYGPHNCLSTGIGYLNLAICGRADGGIPKGKYVFFVGDSSSGKSWICMTLLAETTINPAFENYRLIYDNAENGVLMEIEKYWNPELKKRIEAPQGTWESPKHSRTIEEFYYNLDDAFREEQPFVYILDSMDALESVDDEEKFLSNKKAYREGKEEKGTYGMAKAKINSANIKRYATRLEDNGSILIVISQTRDKINSPFPQRTWGGGKALWFYSHVQILTSVKGDLKKTVQGKDRVVGSTVLVDLLKNRITGWDAIKIEIPFLKQHGFDDVGSCIDFLVSEDHWTKAGRKIKATELGLELSREELIQEIEEDSRPELYAVIQSVWDGIQEASKPHRRNKYKGE